MAEQNNSFFANAKNVKLTLVTLSLLSFALLIFLPVVSFGGESAGLFSSLKGLGVSNLFGLIAPFIASIVAFFITLGAKTKSKRWTAGIIMAVGFILFMILKPGLLSMGTGMIIYLILTIAYLAVTYLSKD